MGAKELIARSVSTMMRTATLALAALALATSLPSTPEDAVVPEMDEVTVESNWKLGEPYPPKSEWGPQGFCQIKLTGGECKVTVQGQKMCEDNGYPLNTWISDAHAIFPAGKTPLWYCLYRAANWAKYQAGYTKEDNNADGVEYRIETSMPVCTDIKTESACKEKGYYWGGPTKKSIAAKTTHVAKNLDAPPGTPWMWVRGSMGVCPGCDGTMASTTSWTEICGKGVHGGKAGGCDCCAPNSPKYLYPPGQGPQEPPQAFGWCQVKFLKQPTSGRWGCQHSTKPADTQQGGSSLPVGFWNTDKLNGGPDKKMTLKECKARQWGWWCFNDDPKTVTTNVQYRLAPPSE